MTPSRKGKSVKKTLTSPVAVIDKKLSDIAVICTFEKMKPVPRTAGDGMEQGSELEAKSCSSLQDGGDELPQQVKKRELRFVPYEPYKAAVTPIVTESDLKSLVSSSLKETHIPFPLVNGANTDLFDKSQVPVMKVLRDIKVPDLCQSTNAIIIDANVYQAERDCWQVEKLELEEEIKKLKGSKQDLENQFKIQTQVNKELKKLLVASMGEDMQSRVQFLSEDKVRLAQDISRYSQRLAEDNEELERRAILCDVWRSKFLACSLMVDELAGWKALLSRNFQEAKESIAWLMEEYSELKQYHLVIHRNLKQLQLAFDPCASKGPKSPSQLPNNLLQISQGNKQLVEAIHFRLLGSSTTTTMSFVKDGWNCDKQTPAEELAEKVLSSKDVCLENLSALESTENCSRHKICRFHPRNEPTMNCCRHCLGEINVV